MVIDKTRQSSILMDITVLFIFLIQIISYFASTKKTPKFADKKGGRWGRKSLGNGTIKKLKNLFDSWRDILRGGVCR
jgi:hypothetical protein